jgi:hypothetical protein
VERLLRLVIFWASAAGLAYFGLLAAAAAHALTHPGTTWNTRAELHWNLTLSAAAAALCVGVAAVEQLHWLRLDRADAAAGRERVGA